MSNKIVKETTENYELNKSILENYGTIKEVKDGIVIVKEGLTSAGMSEMVEFVKTGIRGIINQLGKEKSISVLGNIRNLKVGDIVKKLGVLPNLQVSNEILGRVVDPLGNPLDGKGDLTSTETVLIEKKAPGIIERESVRDSLETGVKFLDSMIPIGKGQRELIIGDPKTGKTTVAIDTIINQKGKNVICVYVLIGQKQSSLLKILKTLNKNGSLAYTAIVMASAAEPAVMQFLAPFSGCSIAEFFESKGRDVIIVYDDLSKHAIAYRQMSLLLRRPPGREGYPGDVWATERLQLAMLISKKKSKNLLYNKKFVRSYAVKKKVIYKWKQISEGLEKLNTALKDYEKQTNLGLIKSLSNILLLAGLLSLCLYIMDLNIGLSPIYLNVLSMLAYTLGLLLTIYVCVKRLIYIYYFNLDHNPKVLVKLILGAQNVVGTCAKIIVFACGIIFTVYFGVNEATGVDVIREVVRNYIYGDKTATATLKIIKEKMPKEPIMEEVIIDLNQKYGDETEFIKEKILKEDPKRFDD
jgi:hypothetical protein